MSFRDNLQHLRSTRNMTQEQLAMLLGVSRQSVSKWEAERAYPEMDKLLRLCDMFDCTLDELVCGDMTDRAADEAARMPDALAPQDVCGYDEAMRAFAGKASLGMFAVLAGAALALLLSDPFLVHEAALRTYMVALVFVGVAVGAAIVVPALFERRAFRKAHPFVEDFYTPEQKSQARTTMVTGLVAGVCLLMAALVAAIVLQSDVWLASALFFALLAIGIPLVVRGCLLSSRCDVERYNLKSLGRMDEAQIEALDDEGLAVRARRAKRDRSVYTAVMCAATAVGLVMLFTPASRWFFLAWPVGGLACAAYKALRTAQSDG